MEPADNNNQNPGTTPDLEKLANELSQAATSTPSPELSAPAPVSVPPISAPSPEPSPAAPAPAPAPSPEPAPAPVPEPSAPVAPTPAPVAPEPAPVTPPSPEPAPATPAPAPITPDPEIPLDTPSSPDAFTPQFSAPSATPVADPASVDQANADPASADPAALTTPVDNAPLQPAAPVPGSIGSAQSYVDPAAQAQAQNAKKPKFNRTTILIIILAAVVLIGGVILAIILITSNSPKQTVVVNENSTYTPVPEETTPVISGLVCVAAPAATEYIESINNPSEFSETIKISFVDDELSTWSKTLEATYGDLEAAAAGLSALQSQYNSYWSNDLGLAADPMTTSDSISENTVTYSHSIREDNLSLAAATYMRLDTTDVTDVSDLDLTSKNFESIYTELGYTCASAEAESESEETE